MKVTLVSYTDNPLDSVCIAIAIMKEKEPFRYVLNLSIPEKENMVKEMLKSRLIGALEFATFEFLLEGVSRAFTHQLVRHRTFHFAQQSMRFYNASESEFRMPSVNEAHKERIEAVVDIIKDNYKSLIAMGCPTEDARSILPTNICTKIMFGATLRSLIDLAEVRLCHQTQGEFQEVVKEIKKEISGVDTFLGSLLIPACTRSGRCEFKSVYDRVCPIESTLKKGDSNGGN